MAAAQPAARTQELERVVLWEPQLAARQSAAQWWVGPQLPGEAARDFAVRLAALESAVEMPAEAR